MQQRRELHQEHSTPGPRGQRGMISLQLDRQGARMLRIWRLWLRP
jgi:hypothetical protein